jgi:DNA-directed RNA polymerase
MLQRQKDLEKEMVDLGVLRYRRENQEARKGKHESTTPAGIQFIRKGMARVAKQIDEIKVDHITGKANTYPSDAIAKLYDLPSEVIAFLALKGSINHLSAPVKLVKVALEVGSFIEDEARFRYFKNENPALFGVVSRDLSKRTTNYRKQKRVLVHSSNKANIKWTNWTTNIRLRLGQMLCEIVANQTKLFEIKKHTGLVQNNRKTYWLEATEDSLKWIDKKNSICELLSPVKLPCIIPPRKWSSLYVGGYYTYTGMNLIKSNDEAYLKQMEHMDLSRVFHAVNVVQETGWRVNPTVFKVMDALFTSQSSCSVIPEFHEKTMPDPYPKKGTKDEQIDWKRRATMMYTDNVRKKTKRIQFSQLMWMTRKFKDEKAFYFPHTLDFRGRMYANTAFLNPQGEDSARGLLEFSKGKPMGNHGLPWLQVHLANCYGYDKVSLEDRVEWTLHHEKNILEIGKNPLTEHWWMEADKPWQFLRACIEYVKVKELGKWGEKWVSHLPITVDGSCNGLQHFSAMLRDERGGKATNLTDSDQPEDIYEIVRKVVKEKISKDSDPLSNIWNSDKNLDRSLVKRPVMTTPYGATLYGMREQLHEEMKKQMDKGKLFVGIAEGEDLWKHCKYLAGFIYEAIGEVVISARKGMKWLQDCASTLNKADMPIYWTLPTGFMVKQKYLKSTVSQVKTVINGKMASLYAAHGQNDKINKHRQINGIAPNFVHSLDACHLMLTIMGANDEYGIDSFSVVHDSFGTHACDVEQLGMILREKFIEIYKEDVLEKFRLEQKINLTKPDGYGILVIEEVRNAEFFFS